MEEEIGVRGGGDLVKGSSGDSSISMEEAIVPTEDVVQALLDYLVEPLLPAPIRSSSTTNRSPSLSQQESIAKQMHSVVLLYNYYHRKQFRHLEFLDFESFCKVSVNAKPSLLAYMELMQRCNSESSELEKMLSVTEKAIMNACNTCLGLDASRDTPCMEGWPISKVAVFLIDKMKENCLLLFGSITQGVWSPIEKDIDNSNDKLDDRLKISKTNKKQNTTEVNCKQLAFSAVKDKTDGGLDHNASKNFMRRISIVMQWKLPEKLKEASNKEGIDQTDLRVLESHVVPSLSTEKTAARFYLLQCTKTVDKNVMQVPIDDTITSLQGPLVKPLCPLGNTVSAVVENFHLLPYAGILSDWLSRPGQENVIMECSPTIDHSYTIEDNEFRDRPYETCGTADILDRKTSYTSTVNQEEKVDCLPSGLSDAFIISLSTAEDDSCRLSREKSMPTKSKVSVNHADKKRKSTSKGDLSITKIDRKQKVDKVDLVIEPCNNGHTGAEAADENDNCNSGLPVQESCDSGRTGGKAAYGNDSCNIVLPVQDGMPSADHPVVQSDCQNPDKIHAILSSKGNDLLKASVRALHKKRDELSQQQRHLQDEIALCEQNLQKILSGGDDDLMLKLECIIEACNIECYTRCTRTHMETHQNSMEQSSPQYIKRNKLSEAILCLRNPCQANIFH